MNVERWIILGWLFLCGTQSTAAPPSGDAEIRGQAGPSEIVIRTTNRLAGAIDSLQWNGQEFIDSHDHGRQLQSAASFDCAREGEFWAECFNPTEAGSRADGVGRRSSSVLEKIEQEGPQLTTTATMAYWLAPGEKSAGRPALNSTVVSKHRLTKQLRIGYKALPHVIDYQVTFHMPADEQHNYGQFEALTGYMPPEFSKFFTFRPDTGELAPLDEGPGEQKYPVVFSNDAGTHAMGVYSPQQPSRGYEDAGYGRWRFKAEKVVKWNCVFRERNPRGISTDDRTYRVFVAVGTSEDVRQSLKELVKEFEPAK
jgi:hypothetical protein